jgi:hypothetical protein
MVGPNWGIFSTRFSQRVVDAWPSSSHVLQRVTAEMLIALEIFDRLFRDTADNMCRKNQPALTLRNEHSKRN